MDAKATGGLIARRRKEKNWSQGELTERLHVTDKAVSRWETGRGLPDENPWALGLASVSYTHLTLPTNSRV